MFILCNSTLYYSVNLAEAKVLGKRKGERHVCSQSQTGGKEGHLPTPGWGLTIQATQNQGFLQMVMNEFRRLERGMTYRCYVYVNCRDSGLLVPS